MIVNETGFEGLLVIEPKVLGDERGFFFESWTEAKYAEVVGASSPFVQDNVSFSTFGVLRGLHFQYEPHAQAKLVNVLVGEVFDVVVDVRPRSATFGEWYGITLSGTNRKQLYIPEGFAHGFQVLSEDGALFSYKCSAYYSRDHEEVVIWDDPDLNIKWPLTPRHISEKDTNGKRLCELRGADHGVARLDAAMVG